MTITTNEMLADLGGRIVDLIQENLTPPQFITALSGLATNWDGGTLSAVGLGRQLSDSIEARNRWVDQASAYFQGTATGGPNSDGKYPFTTRTGATVSLECPAKLAAMVTGPSESAQAYAASALAARDTILTKIADAEAAATAANASKVAAAASATAAAGSATTAGTAKTASETARDVTQGYRDTTLGYRDATLTARDLTLTYRDGALTAKDAAVTAKTASESARDAAIAAASSVDTTAINNNLALKFDKAGGQITDDVSLVKNGSLSPALYLKAQGMGTDAKLARIQTNSGMFSFDFMNDAGTVGTSFLSATRVAGAPAAIALAGTSLKWNGVAITTASDLSAGLATKQNSLGFTPVQQGTGINQTNNVVKIGWTAAGRLTATVDSTNLGNLVFDEQLATKAALSHQHAIGDVQNLQTALDGKVTAYPGISLGFAAWQNNSLAVDSAQGDGLLNLVGGANHEHMRNNSAGGYYYHGTRGASRIGLHDNSINLYVGSKASGAGQVAGETVLWNQVAGITAASVNLYTQPQFNGVNLITANDLASGLTSKASLSGATFTGGVTLNGLTMATGGILFNAGPTTEQTITWKMSDRNAYLYGNANYVGLYSTSGVSVWNYDKTNFNVGVFANLTAGATISGTATFNNTTYFTNGLSVGSGISTGLYGDGGNVALRSYSGSSTIYLQNAGGADTQATFSSVAINLYKPTTVTGNVTATGSAFVGAGGGLFVTGQNHRLVFDGSGGTRFTYRSDGVAAGMNFATSEGTFRGAAYADNGGNIGFLNSSNGWRLRADASNLYVGDAQVPAWHANNLAPMTTNTTQTINFGVLKEFVSVAGDVWKSASPGNTYASALGIKGAGSSSDSAVISFHRPGQYATHFGLDQFNRFSVGGWSMGDVRRQLWISGQIPTNTWQTTDDGKGRFYFGANGDTVWASSAYHQWRNGSDATVMSLDGGGNLTLSGELITPGWIRVTGSNGLYWNTWGGGWYMTDSTWMRSYGDKSILTGGNIQCAMWTVTSDERLKSDIKPLTNGSEIIYGTNVYSFIKGGQRMWGVLAQEAQANPLTEVLVNEGGQLLPDGSGNALTVDSMGYVYALIDTVKEQNARIAALEARLA